ncbi:MAG: bifunctional phosphoribosyl-AMP cyclohydrolase/phosphoribosyl-ATP diphosphatase HisIE [Saprospiraceae bacterium]|nr:bifunctional phosphoribosyl-AMP cyclohydrolase/phosphoribosyl-ATP diphosphatase HisIE [Saprospiraceae bacterium]
MTFNDAEIGTLDFKKGDGIIPAIVQDARSGQVIMLGFMNEESLKHTLISNKVTFFSRSKQRLWTKGETSGHYLNLREVKVDCDKDTLLILADPAGPACHLLTDTCFGNEKYGLSFLAGLAEIIADRKKNPQDKSYTSSLFEKGIDKIAQKVGEEAVELVIEAKNEDKDLFLGEAADLVYHFLVLLEQKGFSLMDVVEILQERHAK